MKTEITKSRDILPLYWLYRLKMDALKEIILVQGITPNELRVYGHINPGTLKNFMRSIASSELIGRIRLGVFATLQARVDFYSLQNSDGLRGRKRGKKVLNDSQEEILDQNEAQAYVNQMHRKVQDEAMAYEMLNTEEMNEANAIVYKGPNVTKKLLGELCKKWKDQPIPQKIRNDIKRYLDHDRK